MLHRRLSLFRLLVAQGRQSLAGVQFMGVLYLLYLLYLLVNITLGHGLQALTRDHWMSLELRGAARHRCIPMRRMGTRK